jgi:predicted transcriptional regulator
MASKSSKAFASWRKRMKLSYRQAAEALGICSSAVGFYSRGTRKNNKDSEETAVEVPMTVLLACSAVESDLPPIK